LSSIRDDEQGCWKKAGDEAAALDQEYMRQFCECRGRSVSEQPRLGRKKTGRAKRWCGARPSRLCGPGSGIRGRVSAYAICSFLAQCRLSSLSRACLSSRSCFVFAIRLASPRLCPSLLARARARTQSMRSTRPHIVRPRARLRQLVLAPVLLPSLSADARAVFTWYQGQTTIAGWVAPLYAISSFHHSGRAPFSTLTGPALGQHGKWAPKRVASKVSVSEAARSGVQALLDGGMGAKYSAAVDPRMERPVALCTVARNAKLSRLGFEA
jgi:hypothetical protein